MENEYLYKTEIFDNRNGYRFCDKYDADKCKLKFNIIIEFADDINDNKYDFYKFFFDEYIKVWKFIDITCELSMLDNYRLHNKYKNKIYLFYNRLSDLDGEITSLEDIYDKISKIIKNPDDVFEYIDNTIDCHNIYNRNICSCNKNDIKEYLEVLNDMNIIIYDKYDKIKKETDKYKSNNIIASSVNINNSINTNQIKNNNFFNNIKILTKLKSFFNSI